ncbi:MAG TPA: hypothetical protein VER98_19415 [Terriglobia bacterium]|nr:hypothetical protein [Terriglobia bacterium]
MNSRTVLSAHCNTIEETYELMLAYAAQGLSGDAGSHSGSQLRDFLNRAVAALAGLAGVFRTIIQEESLQPAEKYHAFLDVLERDARDALAAVQIVLSQASISSQLIDNLNASIHLRALLTDLFLIDEIVKTLPNAAGPADR